MDGRLVRLEDDIGDSPLRIISLEQDSRYTATPFFAIIDGRMVIAR
ncbi:hypothetical protein [Salinivibrio kushneri]|nr:hypothetical protein [Salinivibrio kushneri]